MSMGKSSKPKPKPKKPVRKSDEDAREAMFLEREQANAAAAEATELGNQMVSFTDKFYQDYIVPQLAVVQQERNKGIERADQVFNQQQALFQDREGTYQQLGKPAISKYFDMVNEFNPEQEAQRRGIAVMGDITAQQANAQQQTERRLRDRGINASSGDTIRALGRNDITAAMVKAQEMNRLRNLTTNEGRGLIANAANFGAGLGQMSPELSGQALQAGVIGSDIATQSTGTLTAGAAIPMTGLGAAADIQRTLYGGNQGAETSALGNATQARMGIEANAAAAARQKAELKAQDGGAGGLIGTIAGGLVSGLSAFSDRRLKKNITLVGTRPDGINVYTFEYLWDDTRYCGYMADEVVQKYPDAVYNLGGYDMVDYSKVEYKPW